jgi:hypothetical protein
MTSVRRALALISLTVGLGCDVNTGPDLVICPCLCAEGDLGAREVDGRICVDASCDDEGCNGTGAVVNGCDRQCSQKLACIGVCPDTGTCISAVNPDAPFGDVEVVRSGCTEQGGETAGGDPGKAVAEIVNRSSADPEDCDNHIDDDDDDAVDCDDEDCVADPACSLTIAHTLGLVSVTGAPSGTIETSLFDTTLAFTEIAISAPPQAVLGIEVAEIAAFLRRPFFATIDAEGNYSAPADAAEFLVIAKVGGLQTAFDATNVEAITGTYDEVGGVFSFATSIKDVGDIAVATADLTLHFVARPPRVDAGPDRQLECGVASTFVGTAIDPDGDITKLGWTVDNGAQRADGDSITVQLPVGVHTARFFAVDSRVAFAADDAVLTVADSLPPTLSDFAFNGPLCLAAPNHKYVVLRVGTDFTGVVVDACDPAPRLQILGASSNQSDDGLGDGASNADVVVFPDRVCLRAERQGTELLPREYAVHLAGVDAAGNTDDPTVTIRVLHDQRGAGCTILNPAVFADDGDPICEPEADGSANVTVAGGSVSCASAFPSVVGGFSTVLLLARRRRCG